MYSEVVERALQVLPLQRGYHDIWGNFIEPSEEAVRGILRALRFDPDRSDILEQLSEWQRSRANRALPAAIVLRGAAREIIASGVGDAQWKLTLEDGQTLSGGASSGRIELPKDLADGYHQLEVEVRGEQLRSRVILCPATAYLNIPKKLWGLSTQLYSLHSRESEGIGDFQDLRMLCAWTKRMGGAFVGLNPLHALFPTDPLGYSPYSPSSRRALNPIYVRLEDLPEFSSEDLRDRQPLRTQLPQLLDYPEIISRKFEILRRCHERLLRTESERRECFFQFCETTEAHTIMFAKHSALIAGKSDDLAEESFHLYAQWVAREQLQAAASQTKLELGLYLDLAVGVSAGGAEAWEDPELFAPKASAGAPPDLLNVLGQVWGLAPYIPWELQDRAYEPFIETLRFNMQFAGALRIDHIMALQRLFWVPEGMTGRDGVYLHYPLQDLMGIVALESQRNQCVVIGEDLGTVPDEIRAEMERTDVLSYKVLYFMKHYEGDGSFRRPEEYPERALVATSTHDLPTLRGFWAARDLEVRKPLGLYSEACTYEGESAARVLDRERLAVAVGFPLESSDERRNIAVHEYLSRTPCLIQAVQIEDLLCELDQANLPGTVVEHPNWRRRLNRTLEGIILEERIQVLLGLLR